MEVRLTENGPASAVVNLHNGERFFRVDVPHADSGKICGIHPALERIFIADLLNRHFIVLRTGDG